jgi:nucleotide-binding universal stress UspA family protein
MSTNRHIVVGVDGSEGGRRALLWAVREAQSRGGTVQAVTAWQWDGIAMPPVATDPESERLRASNMLDREIETLPAFERRGVPIATETVRGRPADVLTAAARDADVLVLGSHGHSRVWHTVLGSVSADCISKSPCPVVVIPVPRPQPVGSTEPAVRYAATD